MKTKITIIIIVVGIVTVLFGQQVTTTGTLYFYMLHDTPNTYTKQADKVVQVNAGATALEFTPLSTIKTDMSLNLVENTALSTWAGTNNITTLGTIAAGTWQATDVGVAYGGTGASTLTDGGVLLGSGTSAITAMTALGDGAIIVGDGTTDPVALSAFSSSTGDLKHEAGGLEADVSGYSNGIYGMASGATLDIDTIAEIETAIGGATNILTESEIDASSELLALMDDETGTGNIVFSRNPTLVGLLTVTGSITATGSITVGGSASFVDAIHLTSATDDDPTFEFKTTDTAHEIDIFMDESATNDLLDIRGRTALVNTYFHIHSQDGEEARIGIYSGATNYSMLHVGSADHFSIKNMVQDADLILGIDDGGSAKTITWDADVDKLKHSNGSFNFDNDSLITTGTLATGSLTITGSLTVSRAINSLIVLENGIAVHNNDEMDASSELAAIIDDETGTGNIVFSASPAITGFPTITGSLSVTGSLTVSGSLTVGGSLTASGSITTLGNYVVAESIATGGLIFGDATPDADGEIGFDTDGDGATITTGVINGHDGTAAIYFFAADAYPGADNNIMKYDAGTNKITWEADASAGTTAWDDIADPDNNGLTTITFDNAELSLLTGDNDAAASFVTIQNSDGDHTGGNLYLLDLDYSADDGDVDADFIKCQDSGGVVLTIQQNGDINSTNGNIDVGGYIIAGGVIDGASLTEGSKAVYNNDEMDASSELLAIFDDETGTGYIVFNHSPTITGSLTVSGSLTVTSNFVVSGSLTVSGSSHITGSLTSSDSLVAGVTVISPRFDAAGAEDMDYGSGDVTDHTFTTDGTGDAEIVLPADSIGPAEIDSTTGAYDFGGVTSLEIPNSTDPDVDAAGEISFDTDGANETGDSSLRGYDGAAQFLYCKEIKHYTFSIVNPDDIEVWTGRVNPSQPIWFNTTGMTFTITEVYAISDTDNYDFTLFESASATDMSDDNDASIIAIECDADGTECFTDTEAAIGHAVEADHAIIFEDTLGSAKGVLVTISGWFNADIN